VTPQDALQRARTAAAAMRADGAYAEATPARLGPPSPTAADRKLPQWALIEPDISEVRSTRRFGKPMTLFKHGMLRLLDQYHRLLIAEQVRFNAVLLQYVQRLEARIAELEARLDEEPRR